VRTLALELSSEVGSIAARDGKSVVYRHWANDRKNSAMFFRNLAEIIGDFGGPERIVVGLGPGSYAGTRIAISTAIGLATGISVDRDRPLSLLGYPSICAMDIAAPDYCVIGDARRGSFFFARITGSALTEGPRLMDETELRRTIDAVPAATSVLSTDRLPRFERVRICYPSAEVLAQISEDETREFILPPLEPIYLREPHITFPKTSCRRIADERKGR
jgi:tRNA threonylcarbamoyl adenosine modification protein YeaZ